MRWPTRAASTPPDERLPGPRRLRYGRGVWWAPRNRRSRNAGPGAAALAASLTTSRLALVLGGLLGACQFDPAGASGADSGGASSARDAASPPDDGPVIGEPDAAVEPVDCEPNQTRCQGRVLSTCNATGDGFSQRAVCAFTCEADDHCTVASNVREEDQGACGDGAPRLTPASTTSIDAAGTLDQEGAVDLVWFCLSEVAIPDGLTVTASSGQSRSIALLVTGDAAVAGTLSVDGAAGSTGDGGGGGPGGAAGGGRSSGSGRTGEGACAGQGGQEVGGFNDNAGGGGAGAGYGSGGAAGGDGKTPTSGQTAAGGTPVGNCGEVELVPLAGGGGGGGGGDGTCGISVDCGWPGGGGGGAIQISAGGRIDVTGTITASGGAGFGDATGDRSRGGGGGGGAGGGILLEAPTMTVEAGALRAEGGGGALAGAGGGGGGAQGGQGAGAGTDATANGQGGAGGGGGGGRVRLNATAEPSCAGASSPGDVCSSGPLRRAGEIGGQSSAR